MRGRQLLRTRPRLNVSFLPLRSFPSRCRRGLEGRGRAATRLAAYRFSLCRRKRLFYVVNAFLFSVPLLFFSLCRRKKAYFDAEKWEFLRERFRSSLLEGATARGKAWRARIGGTQAECRRGGRKLVRLTGSDRSFPSFLFRGLLPLDSVTANHAYINRNKEDCVSACTRRRATLHLYFAVYR